MTPIGDRKPTTAIDVALAGDILRVANAGLPELASRNAIDALLELRSEHEPFRGFLNLPPNGNRLINSCLLYPPFEQGADGALFLASHFAYAPYAGTALMAAATVLADAQDQVSAPVQKVITLETAVGVMTVELIRKNNLVTHAKWSVTAPNLLINGKHLRRASGRVVPVSLIDAGLPYLVVDSDSLGLALSDRPGLSDAANELSELAGKQFPMADFGIGENYNQYLTMFMSRVAANHIKTVWVSDKGEVANSAGGTGALAVLAACEGDGSLAPGKPVFVEAPGGTFECQITGDRATVAAQVRIVARHMFLPTPR